MDGWRYRNLEFQLHTPVLPVEMLVYPVIVTNSDNHDILLLLRH